MDPEQIRESGIRDIEEFLTLRFVQSIVPVGHILTNEEMRFILRPDIVPEIVPEILQAVLPPAVLPNRRSNRLMIGAVQPDHAAAPSTVEGTDSVGQEADSAAAIENAAEIEAVQPDHAVAPSTVEGTDSVEQEAGLAAGIENAAEPLSIESADFNEQVLPRSTGSVQQAETDPEANLAALIENAAEPVSVEIDDSDEDVQPVRPRSPDVNQSTDSAAALHLSHGSVNPNPTAEALHPIEDFGFLPVSGDESIHSSETRSECEVANATWSLASQFPDSSSSESSDSDYEVQPGTRRTRRVNFFSESSQSSQSDHDSFVDLPLEIVTADLFAFFSR